MPKNIYLKMVEIYLKKKKKCAEKRIADRPASVGCPKIEEICREVSKDWSPGAIHKISVSPTMETKCIVFLLSFPTF